MKKIAYITLFLIPSALFISCSGSEQTYDATGVFETTEVTVSAEQTGKLLQFNVEEGNTVNANTQVGLIDTVQLYLKARQIGATKLVYSAQKPQVATQLATLRQQLAKAQQEVARFEALVKDGAANRKLLDDAKSQVLVLQRQITATESTLNNSTNSLNAQMNTADVQKLQIADQLQKCHIYSPITGTVLEKYAEAGEFVATGRPLFKVSNINDMKLRAYITAAQMTEIKLGQKVTVYADKGEADSKAYDGKITWISDKAEFTPKTIQTRDERANLVYAIKISIKNDGTVKSGMYGDVAFGEVKK